MVALNYINYGKRFMIAISSYEDNVAATWMLQKRWAGLLDFIISIIRTLPISLSKLLGGGGFRATWKLTIVVMPLQYNYGTPKL